MLSMQQVKSLRQSVQVTSTHKPHPKPTVRLVERAEEDDLDDDEQEESIHFIHAMNQVSGRPRPTPKCHINVNETPMRVLIDTGASFNIMAETLFQSLPETPTLRPIKVKVFTCGAHEPLPIAGVFKVSLRHEKHTTQAKVYLTSTGSGMLLSCQTAEELELVKVPFCIHQPSLESLVEEYRHMFCGIGCLVGREVHLHIDKTIQPVALRHRQVAFHL